MRVSRISYPVNNISKVKNKSRSAVNMYKENSSGKILYPNCYIPLFAGGGIKSNKVIDEYFHLPEGCKPDEFQVESGRAVSAGKDLVVEAPTGTGKTAIAYYAVSKNLHEGKKTFYTTPLKALSNQKYDELKSIYGEENVGILTGDRRENSEAPVVIMTTEVYRNMALSNMYGEENPIMQNLGSVIFDEFHYLGDVSRGSVWEESVMYTPKDVQILALSATISNSEELESWIGTLKNEDNTKLVSIPQEARHVPLFFDTLTTKSYENLEKKIKKIIKRGETPDFDGQFKVLKPKLSDFKSAVGQLNERNQLPAVFFIFSRKYSREVLDYLAKEGADLTSPAEKDEIQKIVDKYKSEKYTGADLDEEALKKGYAIHNAGIIPGQKQLIEELFQKKLLKAVIATETLAAGINMPAKTVVISSPYKPCDETDNKINLIDEIETKPEGRYEDFDEEEPMSVRLLTANEFKQMSGRAGRRGIDIVGYVYTMPTDRATEQDFLYLEAMDGNPIESHYDADYAFLSGYYEHNTDDSKLAEIFGRTFYAYNKDNNVKEDKISELTDISSRRTGVLSDRGFLIKEDGEIKPGLSAKMASKVNGYDALTLTEAITSKVFDGITPQALAMTAAGFALPAKSNDSVIGYDTDLSYVFDKTEKGLNDVKIKLLGSVNSMLTKLGKSTKSFSDYDEMLKFAESMEKPEITEEDLKAELRLLRERRANVYKIIKTTGNYSASDVVNLLKQGKIVPSKVLETYFARAQDYKKKINAKSIDDYIEKLKAGLKEADISSKGNKAKARIERRRKETESALKTAAEMKYIDENALEALESNNQFIKKNPLEQVKREYNETEKMYIEQSLKDVLVNKINALRVLEENETDGDTDYTSEYDERKVKKVFKVFTDKSAEIHNTEISNGINSPLPQYNKEAAQTAYIWARLNLSNPYDTMGNWGQLIKMSSENQDEGSIYRNIMQTADLLSQIGEMAQTGFDGAESSEDKEYFLSLKDTARQARELILNPPLEI